MPLSNQQPQFIIAGATRSGTTTLHNALSRNASIFMPAQKEVHFFSRDSLYASGLDAYRDYFSDAANDQICGEACPTYFTHAHIIANDGSYLYSPEDDSVVRLARDFPDMKIIISLRHPARRAHSFHSRVVWQGQEKNTDFSAVIEEELSGVRTAENTVFCPLYLNHYATHLKHWFSHFPAENIKVLIMEEWVKAPAQTIQDLEGFIGVPRAGLRDCDIQKSNEGRRVVHPLLKPLTWIAPTSRLARGITRRFLSKSGYERMDDAIFARLCDVFADDIAYVEGVLGREIAVWRGR